MFVEFSRLSTTKYYVPSLSMKRTFFASINNVKLKKILTLKLSTMVVRAYKFS